jgi:hypothetical protein
MRLCQWRRNECNVLPTLFVTLVLWAGWKKAGRLGPNGKLIDLLTMLRKGTSHRLID